MSTISIVEFQERHVVDVARVLAKSFITLNSAWKNSNLSYEEVYRIMRGKVLPALDSLMTFVIFYSFSGYHRRRYLNWRKCFLWHAWKYEDADYAESNWLLEETWKDRTIIIKKPWPEWVQERRPHLRSLCSYRPWLCK